MLDIGWTEMAFIAAIALIVIGPKDLPKAMRTVSRWVRKARSLAREFQSGLDDIARESEIGEIKDQITGGASFDLESEIENSIDPTGSVKEAMDFSSEISDLDADPDSSSPEPATSDADSSSPEPAAPDSDYIPPDEEEVADAAAEDASLEEAASSGPAGDEPSPEPKEEASA